MVRKKRAPAKEHRGNKPNDARRRSVITMYEGGLSLREIAEARGVSFQAVHAMLERAHVPMRSPGGNQGGHSRHRR